MRTRIFFDPPHNDGLYPGFLAPPLCNRIIDANLFPEMFVSGPTDPRAYKTKSIEDYAREHGIEVTTIVCRSEPEDYAGIPLQVPRVFDSPEQIREQYERQSKHLNDPDVAAWVNFMIGDDED